MKKNFKRTTSFILAATIVLSSVPSFATGNNSENMDVNQSMSVDNLSLPDFGDLVKPKLKSNYITEGTYYDFFPDTVFAEVVARSLYKDPSDKVTAEELATVRGVYGAGDKVKSIEGIEYLKNLVNIQVYKGELLTIPESIGSLSKLESISFSENTIVEIPESIGNLSNLKSLSLDNNHISKIPESIGKLHKLESVFLHYNRISEIPDFFENFPSLTLLYLSENSITKLPDTLMEKIKNNETYFYADIHSQVGEPSDLYVDKGKIKAEDMVHKIISQLNELYSYKESNVEGTIKIYEYENGEQKEKEITLLELFDPSFNLNTLFDKSGAYTISLNIPKKMQSEGYYNYSGHSFFYTIIVSEDTIETTFNDFFPDPNFAESVANSLSKKASDKVTEEELSTITNVYGGYKNIENIEGIEHLKNLEKITLNGNKISEIPESIGTLKNLTYFHIPLNKISKLPESIGDLSNLREFNLFLNQIEELPESIGNLSNLVNFYGSSNKISKLPESIGNLSKLKGLYIHSNEISEIPESIGNLTNLENIDFSNNRISKVPDFFGSFPSLKELYIYENSIEELPKSLIEKMENKEGKFYHRIHNQIADSSNLEIEKDLEIKAEDIVPKIITQFDNLYSYREKNVEGTLTVQNEKGEQEKITLMELFDPSFDLNSLFNEAGSYKVKLDISRQYDDKGYTISYSEHKFTYEVNVKESSIPVDLEFYSQSGEYLINIYGDIKGQFKEGSRHLTSSELLSQNLTIELNNTKTGEKRIMGPSTIEALRVNVVNGKIEGYRIHGRAQTPKGNFETYTTQHGNV